MYRKYKIFLILLFIVASVSAQDTYTALEIFSQGLIEQDIYTDYQSALEKYLLAELFAPRDPTIKYCISEVLYTMGFYDNAMNKAIEAQKISPNDEEVNLLIGRINLIKGKCEKALPFIIESYLAQERDYSELMRCFNAKGNFKQTINVVLDGLRKFPESMELLLKTGLAYGRIGEYELAIEYLNKSISIDISLIEVYEVLFSLYFHLGMEDSLFSLYSKFLRVTHDDPDARLNILRKLLTSRLNSQRLDLLIQTYLGRFPKDSAIVLQPYGYYLLYIGEDEYALKLLNRAVELGRENADIYFYSGVCCENLELFDSAVVNYKRSLEIEPRGETYTNLAGIYGKQEKYDSLISLLNQGLEKLQDKFKFLFWGGAIFSEVGLYDLASRWLQKALFLQPGDNKVLFALGDTRERAGYRPEAISILEKLYKLDPDNPRILNYLGYLLVDDDHRIKFASKLIKKALKKDPDNAAYIDSYGWALFRKGKVKSALDVLLRAENIYGKDPTIQDHIGDVYFSLGKVDSALFYWKKSIDLDPYNNIVIEKIRKNEIKSDEIDDK